jgi:hypothetical protein
MAMSVSWRGLGPLVGVRAGQQGVVLVEVEVLDPPLPALVQVDRPRMGDVEDAGLLGGADEAAGLGVQEPELHR